MSNLVPDNWESKKLDTLTKVIDSAHQTPVFSDTGIPMVRVGDINGGKVSLVNTKFVTDDIYKIFAKNHEPTFDDVLMTRVGSYGRSSIVKTNKKFCLGQNTVVINPKDINSDFLFQFLQTENINNQIEDTVGGSSQKSLSLAAIKNLKILNPPIPEQQKIAKILTSVDEVIEKTQAQIDKLNDLKTGMMQELLTKGIGHTEFKDSSVGRIPIEWGLVHCRELTDVITKGTTPTTLGFKYTETGINFIKVESIISNGVINTNKFSYICDEANRAMSRSVINSGDILITIAGATVGKLAIVDKKHLPANTNQALAIVRSDTQKVNRKFLFYWLQSQYIVNSIFSIQTVGAQPNLSLAQIGNFLVPMPDLEEQIKIVNILDSTDDNLKTRTKKLKQYTQVKKALMQDLLTGKVRVKVDS